MKNKRNYKKKIHCYKFNITYVVFFFLITAAYLKVSERVSIKTKINVYENIL